MENTIKKKKEINFSDIEYISGSDLLRLTIAIMLADGKIDPNEYNLIKQICKLKYIPEKEIDRYIEEMKSMENPVEFVLENSTISLDDNVLKILIEIAVSDGEIDEKEVELLCKFGKLLEISSDKIKKMILEKINR